MTDLIRGKVARILNSREMALNLGTSDGVRLGMQFDVLDPKTQDITDPDSKEIIGSLHRPKVRVVVGIVEPQFSIARTFRRRRVNLGGTRSTLSMGILESFRPEHWVEREEDLKTKEKTWEDLDESESYVKTGDPVVQVPEEMASEPARDHASG